MRDYESTSKALRCCRLTSERGCAECPFSLNSNEKCANLLPDAADAIEELLAAVPKWISVEERLPEQFICVFATDGEDVGIAAFQGFIEDYPVWSNAWNLEYIEDQYDEDFLQVKHWMPLPEAPKEVE